MVSSDMILSVLNRSARVPQALMQKLEIPERLHAEDDFSFSSSPSVSVQTIARSLFEGAPLPATPDYGIAIFESRSNVFCLLVDKARKIIVFEQIANVQGSGGAWSKFTSSLDEAIGRSAELSKGSEPFDFVVGKNRTLDTIST